MSKEEQPRRRPKRKKISVSTRDQWASILKDVEKDSVPITVLDAIQIELIDGSTVLIDIGGLLDDYDNDEVAVQDYLNEKLDNLDEIIENVDFYVSIDELANVVQPMTDSFLKGL